MATKRRILKELEDLSKDRISGISAQLVSDSDYTHLIGRFSGPPDTPYAGGTYSIDITLPSNYPFVPPKMKFETRVWHPNVSSQTGAICLDTLAGKWSPVFTIKTALLSLQSLLGAPEPNDPQDAEVAQQMIANPQAYQTKAGEWARRYAGAEGGAEMLPVKEYDDRIVARFRGMGFEERKVIAALRKAGVKRETKDMKEDLAGRVVELLLSE